jgi:two-component system LytT family sensor kinase
MDTRVQGISHSIGRRVWLLISFAWIVPAALSVLEAYIQSKLASKPVRWQDLAFQGCDWLLLGTLTPIIYYLGKRFPVTRDEWKLPLAVHLAGSLGLCVGWASLGILCGLLLHTYPAERPLEAAYFSWMLISLPFSVSIYFAVLGCVYAFSYFVEARSREAHASRLTAQLAEAQLRALRMQLNPHFLFNSLNALSVLVREQDTRAASRMLELVGDVLREVLRSDRAHEIALADEVKFLEKYLAIEQVRFSDRLRVEWTIDPQTLPALVPSFVMQPLVENAIKHGIMKRVEAGVIGISARLIGDQLELAVSDDGAGIDPSPIREGVGLSNTRARLRTLYGDDARVTLKTLHAGGTEVTLLIPFRIGSK